MGINMKTREKNAIYEKCLEELSRRFRGKTLSDRMGQVCAVLKKSIPYFFWVGFYIPRERFLELGPSVGPPACSQIAYTGVCGQAVRKKKSVIVSNVHDFAGHIACDPRSKSEIAVPLFGGDGSVIAVFDVDSEDFGSFDEVDNVWLGKMLRALSES